MLPDKYFTVAVKLEFYQLNEFYCCSTGETNSAVFLLVEIKLFFIETSPTDIPPLNLKF